MPSVAGAARRLRVYVAEARGRMRRARWDARVSVRAALGMGPPDPVARVMFEFARARPGAFVVQIGAHDSSQLDPIRRYVYSRGWRGILVEPIPYVFERLKENYGGVGDLTFENVAIAEADGWKELFYLPQSAEDGLPRWYDALASFRKDVLMNHKGFIPDIEERMASMRVPCMTFRSLCEKHSVEHIDVVQMDTEGYDFEIIKLIDFERYRPPIVQFEELHLDTVTRAQADDYLAAHGFRTVGNGMDRIAVNTAWFGPGTERLARFWQRLIAKSAS